MEKIEVLPVPPELVPRFWKSVCKVVFSKIPGYNFERTHVRLLVGIDQLWVACSSRQLEGAVITSITDEPPSDRKCFQRSDPKLMRSLTIHAAGHHPTFWLDSARERICRYARQHGCRQLFIMSGKCWQRYFKSWWSREWEGVAFARDRRTKSTCREFRCRNTPGYFRPMVPVPADKFTRHMYGFMGTFYFRQEAAA